MIIKLALAILFLLGVTASPTLRAAEAAAPTNAPAWLTTPLSLADAVNLALEHNSAILRAKSDIEAAYGIIVQTRAIALPRVQAFGNYTATDATETSPFGGISFDNDQRWSANLRIVQSIYEGGRINSALRSIRYTREQALQQYLATVADALLEVRLAYYDVLLGIQQIAVQEASVGLLQRELEDTSRRFEAGTVPRFNVLRAEVEVANARPRLIRARNGYRIAKNNLVNLLGFNLPTVTLEDIPLQLSGKLEAEPYQIELPAAVARALESRPELAVFRANIGLRQEAVVTARAGYKPSVQLFAGYGWRNSTFSTDLTRDVSGWNAGAQLNWELFDGFLTKGRLQEARARVESAEIDLDDATRRIELEVRTAYSNFIEAQEVLASQKKVQEQAEEALRLAGARNQAGTGTQLDVLNAQTALTEARTTQVQALRDYEAARARLERAIGSGLVQVPEKSASKPRESAPAAPGQK